MGSLVPKPALAFCCAAPTVATLKTPNVMFYGPGGPGGGPGGGHGGYGGPGGHGGPYGPGGPGGPHGGHRGRGVFGRLYHGPHDPGLPGGGYTSLNRRGKKPRKPSLFTRIRNWWYFHTHDI